MFMSGKMPYADVYFKTEIKLEKGTKLLLSGDIPELGCWHEEYAIEAMPVEPYSEGIYLVIIKLPKGKAMRWKWAIADDDSKVQKWEECIDRKLLINRQILLIYAPWNKEAKIMDESVKNYEFVPAYVLFDIAWQKVIPKRRRYEPYINQQDQRSRPERGKNSLEEREKGSSEEQEKSSFEEREKSEELTKDKMAARERMIELQRKWSLSDRSESMEDFIKKGYEEFVQCREKRKPPRSASPVSPSSPKRVTFKEHPSAVDTIDTADEVPQSTSFPGPSCQKCRDESSTKRLEQQPCVQVVQQFLIGTPESDRPAMDEHTRIMAYLDHLEGEKKKRGCLKEKGKSSKVDSETNQRSSSVDIYPGPQPSSSQSNLMLVAGAIGCAILVVLGIYTIKKWRS